MFNEYEYLEWFNLSDEAWIWTEDYEINDLIFEELWDIEYKERFKNWPKIKQNNKKRKTLTLDQISNIAKKIITDPENEFSCSKEEFEEVKKKVLKLLTYSFKKRWEIDSLFKLSKNICRKIDKSMKNNQIIKQNRHQVATEIILILEKSKIRKFINFLKKSKISWIWCINDVLKNENLSESERENFSSIVKYLRKELRTYSEKNKTWVVYWKRIMDELKKMWEEDLANNFRNRNNKNL